MSIKPEEIISDEEIERVHAYANFGELDKRTIVNYATLKAACGYYQGHTSTQIIKEHGLITDKYRITKKGKEYQSFGKRHDDVLKKVKNLECSEDFTARNFAVSEYEDATGRSLPMYEITRDGFTILAMGFTGKKAMQWKEAYINAFNQMEVELLGKSEQLALPNPLTITPAQQKVLQDIVDMGLRHAMDQKKSRAKVWSRFKNKFQIPRYNALSHDRFEEAASYLMGICNEETEVDMPLSMTMRHGYTIEDYLKTTSLKGKRLSAKTLMENEANSLLARLLAWLSNIGFPVDGCQMELNALYHCLRDMVKINRLHEMAAEDLKMCNVQSGYPIELADPLDMPN